MSLNQLNEMEKGRVGATAALLAQQSPGSDPWHKGRLSEGCGDAISRCYQSDHPLGIVDDRRELTDYCARRPGEYSWVGGSRWLD